MSIRKIFFIVLFLCLLCNPANANLMLIEMGNSSAGVTPWNTVYYLTNTVITASYTDAIKSDAGLSEDLAYGWTVANATSPCCSAFKAATLSSAWVSEPTSFTTYGFVSNTTITGSYATGTWTLTGKVKCNTYYAQKGYVRFRLWQSANQNGTSATEITGGWQSSSEIGFTAANQTQNVSITSASITGFSLSAKYLFLEVEWYRTVAGGNSSARVYFGTNTSSYYLTSPTFTP